MKKIWKIALASIAAFALASCAGDKKDDNSKNENNSGEQTNPNPDGGGNDSGKETPTTDIYYTVTFDLNYTGSTSTTQSVKAGNKAEKPADPTRDGYVFNGWYGDSAATNYFDFEAGIYADTTVYASWVEGNAGDYVKITFAYNYTDAPNNGVYMVQNIKKGRRATMPTSPSRDNNYFDGWFEDSACTTSWNLNTFYKEDATIYADWSKLNTFEAEDLDFSDMSGYGYSGTLTGTQMILSDSTGSLNASNKHFVCGLYYNGATLSFTITAEKAIAKAELIVRLSIEYFDIDIKPDTYAFEVNGTALTGYNYAMTGVEALSGTGNKLPFRDYDIGEISLKEGENTIDLITNNELSHTQEAGTYHAEAPLVDCIKIATNDTLTWEPTTGNY